MLIREKDRLRLIEIFAGVNEPLEVWAYGSRVRGGAHEGSDLDLVMRGRNGASVSGEILEVCKAEIEDSRIPILVDLFAWEQLPESFREEIEKCHEVLYAREYGTI